MKRVTLELGGKSPALIFDDANIENAVFHSAESFLRNSGQICFASSRVLVQETIAQDFIKAVKGAFESAAKNMGDPSKNETLFGPLADKKQFDRVMQFLSDGKAEGVEVLVGGDRMGKHGTYVQPTVLLNPGLKSKVYTDEVREMLCSNCFGVNKHLDFWPCHLCAHFQGRGGSYRTCQ